MVLMNTGFWYEYLSLGSAGSGNIISVVHHCAYIMPQVSKKVLIEDEKSGEDGKPADSAGGRGGDAANKNKKEEEKKQKWWMA